MWLGNKHDKGTSELNFISSELWLHIPEKLDLVLCNQKMNWIQMDWIWRNRYLFQLLTIIMQNLWTYLIERNYLYGMCQMTGYMPENENLFYQLNWDKAKELFQEIKDLYKSDKKKFTEKYQYITELELFINRKWRLYRDYPEFSDKKTNCDILGKIWEKMHDFNCSRFKYETPEWKYYF